MVCSWDRKDGNFVGGLHGKVKVWEKIVLKISHTRGWKDISEVRRVCCLSDDLRVSSQPPCLAAQVQ